MEVQPFSSTEPWPPIPRWRQVATIIHLQGHRLWVGSSSCSVSDPSGLHVHRTPHVGVIISALGSATKG